MNNSNSTVDLSADDFARQSVEEMPDYVVRYEPTAEEMDEMFQRMCESESEETNEP